MGELQPRFERIREDRSTMGQRPLPTAGAIPVKNEKGEIVMQKVKVNRYVAGQAPKYAREGSSESDEDDFTHRNFRPRREHSDEDERKHSPERRRGASPSERRRGRDISPDDRRRDYSPARDRRRDRRHSPEERRRDRDYKKEEPYVEEDYDERERAQIRRRALEHRRERERLEEAPIQEELPEDDSDDDQAQRRRERIKMERRYRETQEESHQAKQRELLRRSKQRNEVELLKREKEEVSDEEESSAEEEETEEESESSEDDSTPMLKPVFVKKRDRVTLLQAEEENKRLEKLRIDEEKRKEERKKESAKIMQETLRREEEMAKHKNEDRTDLASVNTDDENEEVAYELWKIREIKRLKRNRDEREALAREKAEIEKIHGMTEEQRKEYLRLNPKMITNKADKGKYKFLQKYYHRGAFYLDQEDDVLKRDFAEATGEDEFDKTILPKVMQVKNFGKASRSKWTHLTAEDTTDHQGTWATETTQTLKFHARQGGMKSAFDRPAAKKRRTAE